MVFCYQNCKIFDITSTIYSNSEKLLVFRNTQEKLKNENGKLLSKKYYLRNFVEPVCLWSHRESRLFLHMLMSSVCHDIKSKDAILNVNDSFCGSNFHAGILSS